MVKRKVRTLLALLFSTLFLLACEGLQDAADETTNDPGQNTAPEVTAASLAISSSQTTVRSDNSDSAQITVTALDANRGAVEGVAVTLTASAGQLSSSGGLTDASGQVSAAFSAGGMDPSNVTATITARATGAADAIIPLQIAGSTATVAVADSTGGQITSLNTGETATVAVTAKDAGGNPVNGAEVTLTASGKGAATLEPVSGVTDATGKFTSTLMATSAGDFTVTGETLGDTDSATLTIQGDLTTLQITEPVENPAVVEVNTALPIVVSAPNSANVTFVTSHGQWDDGSSYYQVAVDSATQQAVANFSAAGAGTANIQVFDSADSTLSDSLTVGVVVSQVTLNSQITVQAENTTIPVSSVTNSYSTVLTAAVKNEFNQPISGAPVVFSLLNTTGGGEYITPSFGTTGDDGKLTTTFTAGTNSSDSQGVTVRATLYMGDTAVDSADQAIIINQKAGSLLITGGTKIRALSETTYAYPFSVQVTDSGGNPVEGQTVTLKVWPVRFAVGYRFADNGCDIDPDTYFRYPNEDTDRDNTLDPGEDLTGAGYIEDGVLTPPSAASGSVPVQVTTDQYGVGSFDLVYGKDSAGWIQAEITATTQVSGSESNSQYKLWLPHLEGEECHLRNDSPYNYQ